MFFDSTMTRDSASFCVLSLSVVLAACAARPQPPAPRKAAPTSAPAASERAPSTPEPPLPQINAVALTAHEVPGVLELTLTGRGQDGPFEILQLALPREAQVATWQHDDVHLNESGLPYAFVADRSVAQNRTVTELWVRRPAHDPARELSGEIYTPGDGARAGYVYRFHAAVPEMKVAPQVTRSWLTALSGDFQRRSGAFYAYAGNALQARLPKPKSAPRPTYLDTSGSEFARLIGTSTGRSSIQEALLRKPQLYLELTSGPRTIPIASLNAPHLTRHPWPAMLATLKQTPATEAMAKATPADFYFVRVRDFRTFLDLSDVSESWGTPLLDLLDGKVQDRGLRARYETELALAHGELARSFGPSVIEELAVVGSDPYLVEGSDLTLIFRVKSGMLFDAALLQALSSFAQAHPGVDTTKLSHEGVDITVSRSKDGMIRRHRASVDGYELVSNSAEAVRRVISALHGKAPRLADEPDFAYMLARDADQPAPVLAFAGDRFVESVIGPQQKLKAAQRELAAADLARPGFAALLYGLMSGHSPATAQDLVQAKLLGGADLKPGGVAAGWQPGGVAQTSRGSTWGLLPLLDAPPVTQVTAAEKAGYEYFARDYESAWSDYVDPFAVRVSRTQTAEGASTLDAELRVLPLLRREYRELTTQVGRARVRPGALPDGLRVLLGVGQDSELRHLLSSASHSFTDHEVSFDWLGDYAFVGLADRNELAEAARWQRSLTPGGPEFERDSERAEQSLLQAPVYAGIAIRSTAGAAIALGLLKKIGDEVAPGTLFWREAHKHRGLSIMSVHSGEQDLSRFTLFYCLTPHALLFSLNEAVLENVVDLYADGKAPETAPAKSNARDAQLVVDLKGKPGGALYTVLAWVLTQNLRSDAQAMASADALFRGAPELVANPAEAARVMRNYFGSVPLTLEGRAYGFGKDGVQDPLRGSPSSPKWPVVPVPGSPIAQVLEHLDSVRSQVSFDDEPSAGQPGPAPQSLRVHLTVTLR